MTERTEGIEKDWAEQEHRLGVLPLLAAFFAPGGALDEVVAGRKLGALGLFTPRPDPSWAAGAVAGERSGDGLSLHGDIRLPSATADGSLVLVRLAEPEHRLVWLDHSGPVGRGPSWLHLDGVIVSPDLVSRPVALDELSRHFETYAGAWAPAAVTCAGAGVQALRRAARTAGVQAAQWIALGITEVEIESDLAAAAVRRSGGALPVAVAAARALSAVAAKTEELRDSFGLVIDGPLADSGTARALTAYLGGSLFLEGELARSLGHPFSSGGEPMKLALVGYGKMGRVVEELAPAREMEVVERFTRDRPLRADEATRRALSGVSALVDFSVPEAVADTARVAAELSLPLVIGTTGWQDRLGEVREIVETSGIGAVRGANFSLGVNVLYRLAELAARLLAPVEGYDPYIHDWHHRFKLDSPSGTALEIRRRMARSYGDREVPISCQRAGYVPSIHQVGFDSAADTIHLEHRARNRNGLAEGALLAARWIAGRPGFHDFGEVLDDLLPMDLAL